MDTTIPAPGKKTNRIGLEHTLYRGGKTTLCAGCGHNAISERIIDAFFEMGIDPKQVIKLSGIGCSSKSPAYFLGTSHGFNSVHGRMMVGIPFGRLPGDIVIRRGSSTFYFPLVTSILLSIILTLLLALFRR